MRTTLFILSFIFVFNLIFGQAGEQGLSISLHQIKKLQVKPIKRKTVTVVVNDTLEYNLKSDNNGRLAFIKLPPGNYSIAIKNLRGNSDKCSIWHPTTVGVGPSEIKRVSISYSCDTATPEQYARRRDNNYEFLHGVLSIFLGR
jgi:hypothetical protein